MNPRLDDDAAHGGTMGSVLGHDLPRAHDDLPGGDDDFTRGMVEIRHVASPDDTRAAYDALYAEHGIANLVRHYRRLLDWADARPGLRLLDVACGEAGLLHAARARGLAVHGVDLSAVALARGRRGLPAGALVAADGEALPFADGCFDRVTSIGSLEHYERPVHGVREMARVLAPGGLALVLVPNTFGLRWNVLYAWSHGDVHDDGQPIQRYATRRQWERVLDAGGLVVARTFGCEKHDDLPSRLSEWWRVVRHPSRLLVPLAPWIPVDMASMFVFVCRKGAGGPGTLQARGGSGHT